jgi:glycosyltransferase involved in cell wall biosynthesis
MFEAKPPRVGIHFAFTDDSWLGGVNAIGNLLHALTILEKPRIEPVIIAGAATPYGLVDSLPKFELLRTRLVDSCNFEYLSRRVLRRALGFDPLIESWLRANKIDILCHSPSLGKRSSIPTIGYIADFGYQHFKNIYSADVWAKKHAGMVRICNEYDTLLMSSRAVAADYSKFFPAASARPAVLHFIPARVLLRTEVTDLQTLMLRYKIPERFFYVPNQFWVHKNHQTIVEALELLASEGREVHVVSTGLTKDERQPGYFSKLMLEVERRGVADRFHVLGIVPYADAGAIMRHSVAVVSASRFEGWGLSVAEAKLLGKLVILSDIPVFREQSPEHGVFFDPLNPRELAGHLVRIWETYSLSEDLRRQQLAEQSRATVIRAYARGFEEIVIEAMLRRRGVRQGFWSRFPNG